MNVPFLDLAAQVQGMREELQEAFARVLENTSFTMGPEVEELEKEFAAYCGSSYGVGVNSGTSALHLALLARGVGQGHEVITQPNSFFATAEAISYAGATPVFVDVQEGAWGMDPAKLEQAITPKTKAIIPVHLYGNAVDLDALRSIAEKHNLIIIEDAAQAHGTAYKEKKIGSFGNTTCFSFYPGKVLGALGEGGMVLTNSAKEAEAMRQLRDHGQKTKHDHVHIGYNYRLEQLQAAFLRAKLNHLDAWVQARRNNAALYDRLLGALEPQLRTPQQRPWFESNYYVYAVQAEQRGKLTEFLQQHEIGSQVHYPTSIHLQKAYSHLGYKEGDFPIAEKLAQETLSLPMYPELAKEQIEYVAEKVHEFYAR